MVVTLLGIDCAFKMTLAYKASWHIVFNPLPNDWLLIELVNNAVFPITDSLSEYTSTFWIWLVLKAVSHIVWQPLFNLHAGIRLHNNAALHIETSFAGNDIALLISLVDKALSLIVYSAVARLKTAFPSGHNTDKARLHIDWHLGLNATYYSFPP